MQVTLTETSPSQFPGPEGPMAWLENGHGPIARGAVTLLSLEGAHIRMLDIGSIEPGDEVDVRLRLDRDTPSVAATGRSSGPRSPTTRSSASSSGRARVLLA